jgi:lysozyme
VRTLGPRGVALIQSFEQLRLVAYRNFPGEPWTCGWGHTGADVTEGTTCTPEKADQWFDGDTQHVVQFVNNSVTAKINQSQFDALCSFAYNAGIGAEAHSTLLRLVNAQDFTGASREFIKWDHVNGVEVAGLKRRREAERDLFNSTEAT